MSKDYDDTSDTSKPADFPVPLSVPAPSRMARLRGYFLTGFIVTGPVAITLYITWSFVSWVDGLVKPLVPAAYLPETYLPFAVPGFGLVVALFGLALIGFLTANLVGRSLISYGELLLDRMPVVRGLYKGMKQIFQTIFSQSGNSFRKVGLVEFPAKGMWSIVFLSDTPAVGIAQSLPEKTGYISVFLPCTPNPTTGFFFYLQRSSVIELPISVDDGAKLVMSAGLIQPQDIETLKSGALPPISASP
jgi:uncharacterized membrane protein